MSQTVQSLKDLVARQGKSSGLKDASSSIIIANLTQTTAPMCVGTAVDDDEQATDDFRLIYFILDASGSMEDVQDEVREGMNEIVFPGLLGGAAKQVGAIRFGGIKFATDVTMLWQGFRKLDQQFPRLTRTEYSASGSTALNRAILDGVTALTTQALQVKAETGTHPECVLAALSDGANRESPRDPGPIKQVLDDLDPRYFTLAFLGFETWENVDFHQIGQSLGFRDIQALKAQPGETKEQQQRRMRHMLKTFSGQLVARVSTSQVGTASTGTGNSGFWAGANP